MKLIQWLSETKIKVNDLAHLIQVSRNHLYLIRRGKKNPSKRLMKKIKEMTMGHVATIDDFRDEICLRHKIQKRISNETKVSND